MADASRREFLAIMGAAVLSFRQQPDSLAGSGPAGKVWDPYRAGRNMTPWTAVENDAGIQVIEKQLHCTCGCNLDVYTCRTTDFTCTVSPAMHAEVVTLAARGLTGQQILDDFVARHGQVILMAPPKRGFNLAGYFVPGLLILAAGAVLVTVLRRWTRRAAPAPSATPAPASGAASAAELERLRHELEQFSA